jgi:phosphate uptake regulator
VNTLEERTLQVTGGSSYVITLPKDWTKNLQENFSESLRFTDEGTLEEKLSHPEKKENKNPFKGLRLGIIEQSDGSLLITPHLDGPASKEKLFKLEEIDDQDYLFRCLIGAYIAGYDVVRVMGNGAIPAFADETIQSYIRMTNGQEVVEETENSIIIKDLLDPSGMIFDRTIKRMYVIAKKMYNNAISVLTTKDKELAKSTLKRDEEIDRLHWLISRQYNTILNANTLREKLGISLGKATNILLVSKIVERIGDHTVRIVKNVLRLADEELDKDIIKKLEEASEYSMNIFNHSIESFFQNDLEASNKNIDSVRLLEDKCDEITELAFKEKGKIAISLGYIVESIRRIGDYAEDICESSINYIVGEDAQ